MSKMMKSEKKALVPRLRFPEFRDAGEWAEKKLGTQGDFLSSLVGKSAKDFDTGNAKFIPYMNVFSNTFIDVRDLRSVNVTEGESQNAVAKGDVFFTVSSETQEEAGMSSVLLDEINNCYLNSFCAMFRFDNHRSQNPVYLGYWLRSGLVREYLSRAAQGAIRYNISKPIFRGLPLLLPSPLEQQRIADCLTSLDALIAAHSEKLDALKTHKKGLMQQLFPREGETLPRLRFPEFREAGEWKEEPLGNIAEIIKEKAGQRKCTLLSITSGVGLVSQMEKFGREIAGAQYKNYVVIRSNDFAYNKSATKEYPEGFIAMYYGSDIAAVPNSIFTCFRIQDSTIYPKYLNYLFSMNLHGKWLRRFIAVGARAHGSLTVDDKDLLTLPVPLPDGVESLPEQQRIADCLTSLDALIAAQSEKLDALKTHKKGLMQQLFPSVEAVGV